MGKNGLTIDGQRVHGKAGLKHGSLIEIGDHKFELVATPAADAPALA